MSVKPSPDASPAMADDQATLGSFAGDDSDRSEGGSDGAADADTAAPPDAHGAEGAASRADSGATEAGDATDDLVCPWCLAAADRFVETGPTGLACGRCSAALPADADWFRAREIVARRPMYEVET